MVRFSSRLPLGVYQKQLVSCGVPEWDEGFPAGACGTYFARVDALTSAQASRGLVYRGPAGDGADAGAEVAGKGRPVAWTAVAWARAVSTSRAMTTVPATCSAIVGGEAGPMGMVESLR